MSDRTCAKATEAVYLYLDNETSRWRQWQVKRHLRKCPPCCSKFDFEAHLRIVVKEGATSEPPPELFDRLRAFLHEQGAEETEI
jgi:mycothiol system anti-sigma-R factor